MTEPTKAAKRAASAVLRDPNATMDEKSAARRLLQGKNRPAASWKQRAASGGQTRNTEMICPYCQTRGNVFTKRTKMKQGISGGKATGAILTAGLSLLAVGLSRKQEVTKATCATCGNAWIF